MLYLYNVINGRQLLREPSFLCNSTPGLCNIDYVNMRAHNFRNDHIPNSNNRKSDLFSAMLFLKL